VLPGLPLVLHDPEIFFTLLTVNLWTVRPVRSTIGLLVIVAGIPFYYRWRSAMPPISNSEESKLQ
jgi:hypothetical protein